MEAIKKNEVSRFGRRLSLRSLSYAFVIVFIGPPTKCVAPYATQRQDLAAGKRIKLEASNVKPQRRATVQGATLIRYVQGIVKRPLGNV